MSLCRLQRHATVDLLLAAEQLSPYQTPQSIQSHAGGQGLVWGSPVRLLASSNISRPDSRALMCPTYRRNASILGQLDICKMFTHTGLRNAVACVGMERTCFLSIDVQGSRWVAERQCSTNQSTIEEPTTSKCAGGQWVALRALHLVRLGIGAAISTPAFAAASLPA